MKKILSIFLFSITIVQIKAQHAYTNIEQFKPGTQLTFQTCLSNNLPVNKLGNHITWDYSTLKLSQEIVKQHIEQETSDSFPTSNFIEYYSDGRKVYLNKGSDSIFLVGFVDDKKKMKAVYNLPILIACKPIRYLDSVSKPFASSFIANGYHFKGTGMVQIIADGQGELILPNGKYSDVIRIKIVQFHTNVMEEYPSTSTMKITTYTWFDKTHTSALLKITEVESKNYNNTSVEYLLSEL